MCQSTFLSLTNFFHRSHHVHNFQNYLLKSSIWIVEIYQGCAEKHNACHPSPRPLPGQSNALPSVAPALNLPLSRSRRRRAPRFPPLRSDIRQSSWWGTAHRWGLDCLSRRPSASAEQPWPAVVSRLNLCPETFSCLAPPKPGKGG